MGFLEQFFKIKKSKYTGHPCTFVQSYMNTISCLNNLFDYNVQLKLNAFSHHPSRSLGSPYINLPRMLKKITKKENSNFTRTLLLKGLINVPAENSQTTLCSLIHFLFTILPPSTPLNSGWRRKMSAGAYTQCISGIRWNRSTSFWVIRRNTPCIFVKLKRLRKYILQQREWTEFEICSPLY